MEDNKAGNKHIYGGRDMITIKGYVEGLFEDIPDSVQKESIMFIETYHCFLI